MVAVLSKRDDAACSWKHRSTSEHCLSALSNQWGMWSEETSDLLRWCLIFLGWYTWLHSCLIQRMAVDPFHRRLMNVTRTFVDVECASMLHAGGARLRWCNGLCAQLSWFRHPPPRLIRRIVRHHRIGDHDLVCGHWVRTTGDTAAKVWWVNCQERDINRGAQHVSVLRHFGSALHSLEVTLPDELSVWKCVPRMRVYELVLKKRLLRTLLEFPTSGPGFCLEQRKGVIWLANRSSWNWQRLDQTGIVGVMTDVLVLLLRSFDVSFFTSPFSCTLLVASSFGSPQAYHDRRHDTQHSRPQHAEIRSSMAMVDHDPECVAQIQALCQNSVTIWSTTNVVGSAKLTFSNATTFEADAAEASERRTWCNPTSSKMRSFILPPWRSRNATTVSVRLMSFVGFQSRKSFLLAHCLRQFFSGTLSLEWRSEIWKRYFQYWCFKFSPGRGGRDACPKPNARRPTIARWRNAKAPHPRARPCAHFHVLNLSSFCPWTALIIATRRVADGMSSTCEGAAASAQPSDHAKGMIENPTPRSSLETQSATDVAIRLKNLEDLHSSTSFLLQQRLIDLPEIERRLSTLQESLRRRDEALGDAVAVVTVVDDEEEISHQASEDR